MTYISGPIKFVTFGNQVFAQDSNGKLYAIGDNAPMNKNKHVVLGYINVTPVG